jgi:hypothetical protein
MASVLSYLHIRGKKRLSVLQKNIILTAIRWLKTVEMPRWNSLSLWGHLTHAEVVFIIVAKHFFQTEDSKVVGTENIAEYGR